MPDITIYEVGPRDGLQSHNKFISTEHKVRLIEMLHNAGLQNIEATSFVNPKKIPMMADAEEVFLKTKQYSPSALVPNMRGFKRAKKAGVEKINIFLSADERFNKNNLGMSLNEALSNYKEMLKDIPRNRVRVYISCFFDPNITQGMIVEKALTLGSKIVLCDTDGKATPEILSSKLHPLLANYHPEAFAIHFHKGNVPMMDNVSTAYNIGIREFDSSIGGLGGCPLFPNSNGNLPTEDLVSWAKQHGIECGVNDVSPVLSFLNEIV